MGKHKYRFEWRMGVKSRLSKWFGSYKWPVTVWFQHRDDCCDTYWITDPQKIENALRQDDDLGVKS